jgi:two-component system, cell cycle sensor histidine kinase and response regulator CckA
MFKTPEINPKINPKSKWIYPGIALFMLLVIIIIIDILFLSFDNNNKYNIRTIELIFFSCGIISSAVISVFIFLLLKQKEKDYNLLELKAKYQYQIIQEIPISAVQRITTDGLIIQWNKASEHLFGFMKEETIGKNLKDLIFFDNYSKDDFLSEISEFEQSPHPNLPNEWKLKTKDGKILWVYSYLYPYIDEYGKINIYCFQIDITKLKSTEEELVKSVESYVSLFENSMDGIFRTTMDGKFITVNTALAKMLGYSGKDEIIGIDILKELYFNPNEREITYQVKDRDTIVYKLRSKQGKEIWVEENIRKIIDNDQIYFEGIVRDITSRKQSLEEKEKLYHEIQLQKTIFEHTVIFAPFGVMITDAISGEVYLHNLAINKIFGIINDTFYELYNLWKDPNFSNEDFRLFEHLRETGEVVYLPEFTWDASLFANEKFSSFVTKTAVIRAVAFPVLDMNEKVSHFVIILEDITNQRNLEAQIRHAVKMESVGNLAGGIAHDFNNLLTGIIGNTALALSKIKRDSGIYNYLINVEKASKRAAELTKQLLSFSRKTKIHLKPINLNSCIDEIVLILKRTIDPKIVIERRIASNLSPINADSGQIIQVIMNLCVNARDAITKEWQDSNPIKKESKIILETENVTISQEYCDSHFEGFPGDFVCLKISDTGCGIDKKVLEKIFEPFYTTKETSEGTGLGLSIVYSIVKQHNGWINVYSESKIGTTFKIYIPSIIDIIEEEDYEIKTQIRSGKETILLVDDEEIVLDLGTSTLQAYGYKVLAAKDGKEAMEIFNQQKDNINLVLLDYAMPKMNGAEVIHEVKKINPKQKIILMSGYISELQVISDTINMVDTFIQKPYEPDFLLQAVRDVLDKK